jgi:putative tryptophan/tyrosine transport system substrate-binding protein
MFNLRRREFITLLGGAATWPVVARAQQSALPVIGLLHSGSPDLSLAAQGLTAFRKGLNETGFAEGRNVSIQYRWAEDRNDRFPHSRLSWCRAA